MKCSCVTWVPALWFGWTLKRRMRAGPGLMAIFLTRVPRLYIWCWFFIVSQAKLESLSTLQSTAPICPTGVNWFGLHWAWNFPEAALFSWGWPRWKRSVGEVFARRNRGRFLQHSNVSVTCGKLFGPKAANCPAGGLHWACSSAEEIRTFIRFIKDTYHDDLPCLVLYLTSS